MTRKEAMKLIDAGEFESVHIPAHGKYKAQTFYVFKNGDVWAEGAGGWKSRVTNPLLIDAVMKAKGKAA